MYLTLKVGVIGYILPNFLPNFCRTLILFCFAQKNTILLKAAKWWVILGGKIGVLLGGFSFIYRQLGVFGVILLFWGIYIRINTN
jgi:hypothetical protein